VIEIDTSRRCSPTPAGHPGVHCVPVCALRAGLVQQPQERLNKEIPRRTDLVEIFRTGTQ
jgi:hypothetical protein